MKFGTGDTIYYLEGIFDKRLVSAEVIETRYRVEYWVVDLAGRQHRVKAESVIDVESINKLKSI